MFNNSKIISSVKKFHSLKIVNCEYLSKSIEKNKIFGFHAKLDFPKKTLYFFYFVLKKKKFIETILRTFEMQNAHGKLNLKTVNTT